MPTEQLTRGAAARTEHFDAGPMHRDAGAMAGAGARQRARTGTAGSAQPASANEDATAADSGTASKGQPASAGNDSSAAVGGGGAKAGGASGAADAMTTSEPNHAASGMGGTRPAGGGYSGSAPPRQEDGGSALERMLHVPTCPTLASPMSAAFCYDFEQGNKGPDGGDAFGLWDTPNKPPASALTTQELPAGSANHVLFASPPLTNMFPSATIGHDTPPFTRAVAELDFWADAALLNVSNDVVFFRYVPDDRDYDHVTSLIVRGGAAFLRTEDNKDFPLARLPSTTDKTHVRIELERAASCSVRVFFDDAPVVSAAATSCAPNGPTSFVEYGLIVLDPIASPVSAMYDNIACDLE